MNKEIADKWVAALRSGHYSKGTGYLQDKHGGFCCLGVLCDISRLGTWDYELRPEDPHFRGPRYVVPEDKPGIAILPDTVRKWAGMSSDDGWRGVITHKLTLVNDSGSSFEAIAEIIEEEWETL